MRNLLALLIFVIALNAVGCDSFAEPELEPPHQPPEENLQSPPPVGLDRNPGRPENERPLPPPAER